MKVKNLYRDSWRRFIVKPKYIRQQQRDKAQRQQGKRQFVRRLRAQLKKLRSENEARQPERYDLDITPTCNGFEAALDAVGEFLDERCKR